MPNLLFDPPPQTLRQIALSLHRKGNFAEAAALYRQLLPRLPQDAELRFLAGTAELQCARPAAAEPLLSQVLALKPDHQQARVNRGTARMALGKTAGALLDFDLAVRLNDRDVDALYNRGSALLALGRRQAAIVDFDRVLTMAPDHVGAINNRGNALRGLRRTEEALVAYDRVIALAPNHADGPYNRAVALTELNRPEEALAACDQALALKPDYAHAYCCRGNILRELGRREEALAAYDRAQELQPDYADAIWDRAMVELLLGRFAEGWEHFEARWRCALPKSAVWNVGPPLWTGDQPIAGKTLLLHAEQGLGDTLQFCRYVPLVAARVAKAGGRVVLRVPQALRTLLGSLDAELQLIANDDPLPVFDAHCPLMSLPRAFHTDLNTIPTAPYLTADPARVAAWAQRLGPKTAPRIGLVWSGRAGLAPDRTRSLPFRHLLPLLSGAYEFHCLQKEIRPADAAALTAAACVHLHTANLHDFADTAALIQQMDLVIAVDTSVAHACGALGRPVWLMLPFAPDWRWLLDRTDSPWYPSARLFRQTSRGDWDGVAAAVARALAALPQRDNNLYLTD